MAQVIHTIKGKQYLYEHKREGDKVVCKYVGPVGSGGKVRAPKHSGGAPTEVTQQEDNQPNEGKTINKIKDNSRLEDKTSKEKSTMGTPIKIDNETINVDMTKLLSDVYAENEPVSTKMVEKRIKAGRPDRALKMAYAGLTKGENELPTMSYMEFARKYEVK